MVLLLAGRLENLRAGLLHRVHTQGRRKNLHPVLLASDELRFLQPGQRGADPRIVRCGVPHERGVFVLAENFARGRDDLVGPEFLAGQIAQCLQDGLDFPPREPGPRRQAELPLDVIWRMEEYATRRPLVAAGAARFLQVVFQGAGDVGMNHHAHVRFVDAHAEGVGRDDHPQCAVDETLLDGLLRFRQEPGVEIVRGDVLGAEKFRHLPGRSARGAIDDRSAGRLRRQVGRQNLMNMGELFPARRRHDNEIEIGPSGAAVEDSEGDTQIVPKIGNDLLLHVGFGRGCEAQHRRIHGVFAHGVFANETGHVAVVGPEIVSPLREAMRFVEHPRADLALLECPAHGSAAELLRRDDEDARVPEAHPVERRGPLGEGEQPVDRDAGRDSAFLQAGDLIRHEGDQRRDDDGQRAGLVVPGEGGDLIAERLARARRQNAQDVLPGHDRFDDRLLHGATRIVLGFRAKTGEAEPALEFLVDVVPFPAPGAGGIRAGRVPKPAYQHPGFGELVSDPRGHDGVPPSHGQPCQRISERPPVLRSVRQDVLALAAARLVGKPGAYCALGIGVRRSGCLAQRREARVESRSVRVRRAQPVPCGQQVGCALAERRLLVSEDLQREPRVQFRVVDPSAFELSVLIMLD